MSKIHGFTLLAFVLILLVSNGATAQTYTETSTFGNTYTPLQNPTLVTSSWDQNLFLQGNIGVTFNWYNQTWPFDGQGDDGILLFGAGTLAGGCPTDSTDFDFDGFFAALQSKNQSSMNYEIDGTSPNRIIKFEWKNAGLVDGDTSDFVNFQMWLYENATYEVHFGPSSVKDPNVAFGGSLSGPPVGLFIASTKKADNNKILKAFYLTGSPTKPTLNPSADYSGLSGMPANGTTYTFNYQPNSGIENEQASIHAIDIYPNPASGIATISYNATESNTLVIDILDITGKSMGSIYKGQVAKGSQAVHFNTSGYAKGLHFIRIQSGNAIETRKLMIE